MGNLEYKLIKKKKIDKELVLKILLNEAAERIRIEFCTKDNKFIVQKSFQNNFEGKIQAKEFEECFKTIKELRNHFNVKQEKKNVIK